jgi:hypothetical protein
MLNCRPEGAFDASPLRPIYDRLIAARRAAKGMAK